MFFDIDGTVLLSGGAGRAALETALIEIFGTAGQLEGYNFHGKTDPQIALELLSAAGLPAREVRDRLSSVWPVYLEALRRELAVRRSGGAVRLLPGVAALLAALEQSEAVVLGLLTGNIEPAARLKLRAAGVTTRFEVGAFGSDSEVRTEIARIAVERSRALEGAVNGAARVVVVGDTPADVQCARAVDGYAVAVATGRHGLADLSEAGADVVFEDFSDTAAVLDAILAAADSVRGPTRLAGDGGSR